MWCPKCKSEFREGFTRCPACEEALVESLTDLPAPEEAAPEPVLLMRFQDQGDLAQASSILEQAGIPHFCREPGSGEYLRIITGRNLFGADLYVDAGSLGPAARLLRMFDRDEPEDMDDETLNRAIDEFEAQYPGEDAGKEDEPSTPEGYRIILIFLAIFGLGALLAILIPLVSK